MRDGYLAQAKRLSQIQVRLRPHLGVDRVTQMRLRGGRGLRSMTPPKKPPGAQFEISIDGKPRSYHGRKAVAIVSSASTLTARSW